MKNNGKYTKKETNKFLNSIVLLHFDGKPEEEFKQVKYKNQWYHYYISSYGRLLNVKYRGFENRIKFMKTVKANNGYEKISISSNGKSKTVNIHMLVAEAFIKGKTKRRYQVNHKDGNKFHNYIWNLEYTTPKENIKHAEDSGLRTHRYGVDINFNKFNENQIHDVCKLLEKGECSFKEISNKTGITYDMVRSIYHRKSWKNVSKEYDFSSFNNTKNTEYDEKIKRIKTVCKLLEQNELTLQQIADISGIKFGMVNKIMKGESYKEISSNYNISNYKSKSVKSKNKA